MEATLRGLLREKVLVRPETLARLPTGTADRLRSPLDLGRALLASLQGCPLEMLEWWLKQPRGFAIIGPTESGYREGVQQVGRRTADGAAWIRASDALSGTLPASLAHLFDHLLGSDGDPGGLWLSDGGGRSPLWRDTGLRIGRQFTLGYAPGSTVQSRRDYLAWGLATFLAQRADLNMTDPGLERLLATTLFDAAFWRRASPTPTG